MEGSEAPPQTEDFWERNEVASWDGEDSLRHARMLSALVLDDIRETKVCKAETAKKAVETEPHQQTRDHEAVKNLLERISPLRSQVTSTDDNLAIVSPEYIAGEASLAVERAKLAADTAEAMRMRREAEEAMQEASRLQVAAAEAAEKAAEWKQHSEAKSRARRLWRARLELQRQNNASGGVESEGRMCPKKGDVPSEEHFETVNLQLTLDFSFAEWKHNPAKHAQVVAEMKERLGASDMVIRGAKAGSVILEVEAIVEQSHADQLLHNLEEMQEEMQTGTYTLGGARVLGLYRTKTDLPSLQGGMSVQSASGPWFLLCP